MDMNNLMQMANQLREKMASAQGEAEKVRVIGESGGGMVRVVMNGNHQVVELKIDPKALSSADDLPLIEDLVRAAINTTSAQVGVALKSRLGNLAQDFGVDMSELEKMGFPK